MNPLKEARDRAEAAIRALLGEACADTDFETRLLDLVEATVQRGTEGFHRRDPRRTGEAVLDPTWIPTAKADLADRLAEAGLVRWEASKKEWEWSDEWVGGVLARRALNRGDLSIVREREAAWLRNADTQAARVALGLEAETLLRVPQKEGIDRFLESCLGREALAVAIALLAPADDEADGSSGLDKFTALLDRIFGAPLSFRPARHRVRVARILDFAVQRLEAIPTLRSARDHLADRLSELLSGAAAAKPRNPALLASLAKSHLAIAKADRPVSVALERCRLALEAVQRIAHLVPEDARAGRLLHEVCERVIELPRQEGDSSDFLRTYALAIDTLTAPGIRGRDPERSLRQRIMLHGWTVDLQWKIAPADAVSAFRRGCQCIDDLIALCPLDPRYREGRRVFAEEFATLVETNDPALAATVRAESRAASPPEPPTGGGPDSAEAPRGAEPSEPTSEPAGSDSEIDREPSDLIEHLRLLLGRSAIEPEWAVLESNAILREICQGVILREMGSVPGRPRLDQMATWLTKSGRLPRRLHYDLLILDWYRTPPHGHPGATDATTPDPDGRSVRALARIARWYLEEYLEIEISAALRSTLEDGLLCARPEDDVPGARPTEPTTEHRRPLHDVPGRRRWSRAEEPTPPDAPASASGTVATLSSVQIEEAERLGVALRRVETRSGMVLVFIPGETVTLVPDPDSEGGMSSRPSWSPVEVRIPAFYCGIAPVLQREWSKVLRQNPSLFVGGDLPVSNVTPEEIRTFLAELNRTAEGVCFRLPLELEWEAAARAGSFTRFWWGDEYRPGWANCAEGGIGSGLQRPTVPGRHPASPYGLLDLHGNVQEWCAKHLLASRTAWGRPGSRSRLAEGDGHVLKGGGWRSLPASLGIAERSLVREGEYPETAGLRCVCDVPEARGEILRWPRAR